LHELGVPGRVIKLHLERVTRWRRAHRKRKRLHFDDDASLAKDWRPRIRNRPPRGPPRPRGRPPKIRPKIERVRLTREPGESDHSG
jgi:hypothetical protein